ncbi:hypothetical protein RJT34_17039 [Clitoria ternatea]|uniref:Exocyst subunit Exo70 family protein n=1 Tax=Clitoria ternatea TaxID=43366 RepID=A0AAN9PDE1_CLITE
MPLSENPLSTPSSRGWESMMFGGANFILRPRSSAGKRLLSYFHKPYFIFNILDLHISLENLMPEIHLVFDSKSICVMVIEVLSRLAEAVRDTLCEFENDVSQEMYEVVVPKKAIHLSTTNEVCREM